MPTVSGQLTYLEQVAGNALSAVESAASELAGAGRLPGWGGGLLWDLSTANPTLQVQEPTLSAFTPPGGEISAGSVEATFNALIRPILEGTDVAVARKNVEDLVRTIVMSDSAIKDALDVVKPKKASASSISFAIRGGMANAQALFAASVVARGAGVTALARASADTDVELLALRARIADSISAIGVRAVERMASAVAKAASIVVRNAEITAEYNSTLYDAATAEYVQKVSNLQRKVQLSTAYVSDNVNNIRTKVDTDIELARTRIRATSAAADSMANVAAAALSSQTAILGAIGSAV